jgi:hypothetical protein
LNQLPLVFMQNITVVAPVIRMSVVPPRELTLLLSYMHYAPVSSELYVFDRGRVHSLNLSIQVCGFLKQLAASGV